MTWTPYSCRVCVWGGGGETCPAGHALLLPRPRVREPFGGFGGGRAGIKVGLEKLTNTGLFIWPQVARLVAESKTAVTSYEAELAVLAAQPALEDITYPEILAENPELAKQIEAEIKNEEWA